MKTPVEHIDFGERGYQTEKGEGIFIDFPKSVTEGFIEEFQKFQAESPPGEDASPADHELWQRTVNRKANCYLLDLVIAWNIDDDAGAPRPLMKTLRDPGERFALLASMPLDFILALVKKVTLSTEVAEPVKDFSSGS